jgi:hypothetical protein
MSPGGSAAYLPPEVALIRAGAGVTINYDKSDIWGLGHVMINMLSTSKSPFDNRTKALLPNIIPSIYPMSVPRLAASLLSVDINTRWSLHQCLLVTAPMYDSEHDHDIIKKHDEHLIVQWRQYSSAMERKHLDMETVMAQRYRDLEAKLRITESQLQSKDQNCRDLEARLHTTQADLINANRRLADFKQNQTHETKQPSVASSPSPSSLSRVLYCYDGVDRSHEQSPPTLFTHLVRGKWAELSIKGMPSRLKQRTATRHGDYVYIINAGNSLSRAECCRYHVVTQGWSKFVSLVKHREPDYGVTIGDRIYYISWPHSSGELETLRIFDPILGTWASIHGFITTQSRTDPAIVALGPCIYIMGGVVTHEHWRPSGTRDCGVYNTTTKKWNTIAKIPSNRASATGVVINNDCILVMGGYTAADWEVAFPMDLIEEYTPSSNTWRKLDWVLPHASRDVTAWYDSSTDGLYIALLTLRPSYAVYFRQPMRTGTWTKIIDCPPLAKFGFCA